MRQIFVLADCQDALAIRVAAELRRNRVAVRVLTPAELSLGCAWSHRLVNGAVDSELRLDLATLTDATPVAVLNRLHGVRFFPEPLWSTVDDGNYAEAEFGALIASWLASQRCLVLGPAATGVLHQHTGIFEWLAMASNAGLMTRSVTFTTDSKSVRRHGAVMLDAFDPGRHLTDAEAYLIGPNPVLLAEPVTDLQSAFLVADRLVGVPDHNLERGLLGLGVGSGCNLLEIQLGRAQSNPNKWVVCNATAVPPDGPAALVAALADALACAAGPA